MNDLTLDEAVATFKRELPNWYWSVTECWVSIHGHCAPDWTPGFRDHPDRGIDNIELEIDKPSGPHGGTGPDPTPAQFLMTLLEKAKAARDTHWRRTPQEREHIDQLRRAVMAAHPDNGGSYEAMAAARSAYNTAREGA